MIILRQKEYSVNGAAVGILPGLIAGEIVGGKIAKSKAIKNLDIDKEIVNREKEVSSLKKDLETVNKSGGIITIHGDTPLDCYVVSKDDIEYELERKEKELRGLKNGDKKTISHIAAKNTKLGPMFTGAGLGTAAGMAVGHLISKRIK